jgi:hypothetical protein
VQQDNTSARIERCFSTGGASATGGIVNEGGLIAYEWGSGVVAACFWDTQTSGLATSAGGSGVQGKITSDMKTLATFTSAAWDFTNETTNGTNDYWRMCQDANDYPRLNWQSVAGDFACPDGVYVEDLGYFAQRWLASDCVSSNSCGGTDMDASGTVTFADFALMAANWCRFENATIAMAAAETGYDEATEWMGVSTDILADMAANPSLFSGTTFDLDGGSAVWNITFESFSDASPIFRVVSVGNCVGTKRVVDRLVMRSTGGWEMAKCRIPIGATTDSPVYFVDGEVVNMPIHINKQSDTPDMRDIYISGAPAFLRKVSMGESRYAAGGSDKYADIMDLFADGIAFDQPDVKIASEEAFQARLNRFKADTKPEYIFTPTASAEISPLSPASVNATAHPAVQIEMYTDADTGEGMLRITNNCTVIGTHRTGNNVTYDYKVAPGSACASFTPYDVYAYHYRWNPTDAATPAACKPFVVPVSDTYVSQSFGGKQSEPGGRIFVSGDVVLGSDAYAMVLAGKLTIVAQRSGATTDDGHIWIADSIYVDGPRYADGLPTLDNPNVLGLVAQGVVKVIDPGMSYYARSAANKYPGPPPGPSPFYLNTNGSTAKQVYVPVAESAGTTIYNRVLPNPMVIEAAITVGGGGIGAENVALLGYGGRRENGEAVPPPTQHLRDFLVLRGSLCEVVRGVVGMTSGSNADGFQKSYYQDERLTGGILPGDLWFGGSYVPVPQQ